METQSQPKYRFLGPGQVAGYAVALALAAYVVSILPSNQLKARDVSSQTITDELCGEKPSFAGHLNEDFVAFIGRQQPDREVCISLAGGNERSAFQAAEAAEEKRLTARIVGECTSACVDFMLAAFRRVTLVAGPTILIHGNPAYRESKVASLGGYEQLATGNSRIYNARCATSGDRLLDLFDRNQVNVAALHSATDALGFNGLTMRERGCPLVNFESDLVSLRSSELVQIFGAKIEGSTCADSDDCFARTRAAGAAVAKPDIIRLPSR